MPVRNAIIIEAIKLSVSISPPCQQQNIPGARPEPCQRPYNIPSSAKPSSQNKPTWIQSYQLAIYKKKKKNK